MNKTNDNFLTTGTITEKHGGDVYRVKLSNGQTLLCWKVARFYIQGSRGGRRKPKIAIGDEVKVEISPKDYNKGMLVGFIDKNN